MLRSGVSEPRISHARGGLNWERTRYQKRSLDDGTRKEGILSYATRRALVEAEREV